VNFLQLQVMFALLLRLGSGNKLSPSIQIESTP
jgi:hypothetical protein